MKADSLNFKKSSAAARIWDDRWARFAMGLSSRGVDPARHEFCRIWVRKFLAFIKPRKFEEAVKEDVEGFVVRLLEDGKAGWQLDQAVLALRVMFEEVDPRRWATPWTVEVLAEVKDGLGNGRAAELLRGPVGDKVRFDGRTDEGEVPEKYGAFMEQVRESLRLARYSYRTEKTYLDWVRRFIVFAQPAARSDIRRSDRLCVASASKPETRPHCGQPPEVHCPTSPRIDLRRIVGATDAGSEAAKNPAGDGSGIIRAARGGLEMSKSHDPHGLPCSLSAPKPAPQATC